MACPDRDQDQEVGWQYSESSELAPLANLRKWTWQNPIGTMLRAWTSGTYAFWPVRLQRQWRDWIQFEEELKGEVWAPAPQGA